MHRTRPRLRTRLLAAVAAIVLTLVTIELAARVYAYATHQVRGMTFDAELGWKPLPHISKTGGVWGASRPASTNSHGWRDAERTLDKPRGVRRIVAIGDSFTFGTEVDDGERFTDLLQDPAHGLEVVNLGVAGYGTDQELRVLETEGFRYSPDVVLLTACVTNDLEDIGYERLYSWPKPSYVVVNGELQLRRPRRTWDVVLRTRSYLVETIFQKFWNEDWQPHPVAKPSSVSTAELFQLLIRRMADLTAERGVQFVAVLAYTPTQRDRTADEEAAVMKRAFDAAGVRWLDTRDLLRQHSAAPDQTYYRAGGTHWNAAGNALVTEAIRTMLSGR